MKKIFIIILSLNLNTFGSDNQIAGPSSVTAIALSEEEGNNECFICSNTYDPYRKKTILNCCNQSICTECKKRSTDTYNNCPFCKKTLDEKLQEKFDECENIGTNAILISAKIGSLIRALNLYKESTEGQKRSTVETLMPILRTLRFFDTQITQMKEKLQEEAAFNLVKDTMIETMSNNNPIIFGWQYGINIEQIDNIVDDNIKIRSKVIERIRQEFKKQKREKILEKTIDEVISDSEKKTVERKKSICPYCNKQCKNPFDCNIHKKLCSKKPN